MDTVQPRNNPNQESMTQDNVYKSMYQMPDTDNLAGNESGVSDTAGMGTTSGTQAPFTPPANEINIAYSEENMSAKYKHGESAPAWSAGAGEGQYQGK